ncbi:hypothetical protein AB0L25_40095 [Spirillospora sp. NPDC052242]
MAGHRGRRRRDVAATALRRGAEAAEAAGVAGGVAWARADLAVTPPPARAFDLVSAQYFPFLRAGGGASVRGLLEAVAPGGTLLVVGHDVTGLSPGGGHGFDPADYYHPADIARMLDGDWSVLVDETRPRVVPPPAGTRHTHDTVLLARRAG